MPCEVWYGDGMEHSQQDNEAQDIVATEPGNMKRIQLSISIAWFETLERWRVENAHPIDGPLSVAKAAGRLVCERLQQWSDESEKEADHVDGA